MAVFRWFPMVLRKHFSGVKVVRGAGLEPASLAALGPKPSAFAISPAAQKKLKKYPEAENRSGYHNSIINFPGGRFIQRKQE